MTRKFTKSEREAAIASLRESVKPGDTLFTILRHRAPSGMTRWIDVKQITGDTYRDGAPVIHWLSMLTAKATGFPFDESRDCLKVGGAGMDMGMDMVYSLSYALFPDGFGCIGENCPSSDHSNGDRDYTPHGEGMPENRDPMPGEATDGCRNHWHRDGGFALRQRWL